MRGYQTNYVNLIADNLRDRYESGFPILKELIQNADDAKARTLIFGGHPGFPNTPQPLLQGPGLWFFNDGEFKQSDANALRSFGVNSKAGDAGVIGKFGLGMKSVFHLCEALYYVAWDGIDFHREGLTPWKHDGHTPHPEWDETSAADWDQLIGLGRGLVDTSDRSWFLLWLPLRMKQHLQTHTGEESGAIISRFPGDDPSNELAFLSDPNLARDVAEMLPLLRHLERVEHKGAANRFVLDLAGTPRLMGEPPCAQADGQVLLQGRRPLLDFSGLRLQSIDADGWFASTKAREEWPRTWYRDELGREHLAKDKTSPEAAVLFCADLGSDPSSRLHWAVFLPVDDGGESLEAERGKLGHSIVLHGQFFLDAGRKKIHGLDHLPGEPLEISDARVDESLLRTVWNQRLAQDVVLPMVLPALARYAGQQKLSANECGLLTAAISKSNWFRTFQRHICRDSVWLRTLQPGVEPRWCLVEGDARSQLRPVPTPPKAVAERPWTVFPELATSNVLPYDAEAPCLWDRPRQWREPELEDLLSRIGGLFIDGPSMEYLAEFLESCTGPFLSTERIQRRLCVVLRDGLRASGLEARRQVAAKGSRLVSFLRPENRLELSAELPESILKDLCEVDASVLLVPRGIDPASPSKALPDERALAAWLEVLNRALDDDRVAEAQRQILAVVQGLLRTLPAEARGRFLRVNRALRVIGVRDAASGSEKPVSFQYIEGVKMAGTLFGFAEGLGEAALGIAPLLARTIPDAEVCLVRAQTYRELFPDDGSTSGSGRIPTANDGRACLAAVGRQSTRRLSGVEERRNLLERTNDPGTDSNALRGLRLLLHGSVEHRMDDSAALWIGRHDQHPAWNRLWASTHDGAQWSLVPEELANSVPRSRWAQANIVEIDAHTLIDEMLRSDTSIEAPEKFSVEDRDEILSGIEHEELWRHLPLHTTLAGSPVSADRRQVFLAPRNAWSEDALTLEAILIGPSQNTLVAEKQKRWLRPLDDRARIEIALSTEQPFLHWRSIMDALGCLPPVIEADLRILVRSKPWVPAVHGTQVKPEDVIDLKESLADEAHRLVAEHRALHGPCFTVPMEIDAAVRSHPAWPRIREMAFASGIEGLERLGLLLEDLPDYHIGECSIKPTVDALGLLARCEILPGWRLLEMAAGETSELEAVWDRLGPALLGAIEAQRLAAVLDWLSGENSQWKLRKSVYDTYLRQLARHGQIAKSYVSNLRLAAADGRWCEAAELCVGAHGVANSRVLDERQEAILGDLVCRAGAAGEPEGATGVQDATFQLARNSASEILREYFRAWDSSHVPAPMVGVVLGLLGPDMRNFADEYLYPHSYEWLVGQLPWRDPGGSPERREWMGGRTVADALGLIQAGVQVETGDEVEVLSLRGQPMQVALEQKMSTLLAGALSWKGGYGVMIPLRRVELGRFQAEQLFDLLRATAERLYFDLYNQGKVDFSALWRELDRSDQLEIRIARRLILDHIPFYLRQLSVKSQPIEAQLAICDSWRRRVAEAEADGQTAESGRNGLSQALEELADHIDRSPGEQQAVVQAVKSKLEQYQYELSSIPLELFQNADDAAVELGQFHAYPLKGCEVPPAARRFVVDERENGLGFMYWGRPVNARGPVGFDGERRGYDRDLEKMLILSASDKRDDEGVTGKFGLGFKSVMLACEQPRILSGRLAMRVVSGILPQPWEDSHEARQRLNGLAADSRLPGTLIELPGVHGEFRDGILERFRQLAGILCVFGRAVRSITSVAAAESNWCWQPSESYAGVEVGQLDLRGEWGAHTTALCVRTGGGSLGPQGFRPLPDGIPALWVTAPTRESSTVGFALNGSFDLDAGRARLAGSTSENLKKALKIGGAVGDAFGSLLERSREDWASVRVALGLASDLDAQGFWESVWFGLTKGWLRRRPSNGAELAREAALGALSRLSAHARAVPNGLAGSLRGFSDASEVRYELSGALLKEDVSAKLGDWARFTARYPKDICVSKFIGEIVREAKLANPQTLDISALVGLLERHRVEPADAEVLGWVKLLTDEVSDWESDDLQERLSQLLFRSEADEWVEARKLLALIGPGLDRDEPRRYALAPPESRLHSDYYIQTDDELPAAAFFLVARQRMDAPSEKLAQWTLGAGSIEGRRAALEYLAVGELGEPVSERVRGQEWLTSALQDPELTQGLSEEQVDRLRRRLVSGSRLVWAVDSEESVENHEPIYTHVDLTTALVRLHEWWSKQKSQRAGEYRNRLYPQGLNLKPDPQTGRIDRSSWLMLLALGSFQGMGLTRETQHRGFIQYCQDRGWWKVFTENDPKKEPEKWMDVIEEYAEAQHDDEEWTQWLAQFPKLYRLRRWLDEYADLFLTMNRFHDSFALDTILAPRANPQFQGGGIDAPPLTRTLKVGSHLVVRELLHHGVIGNPFAVPHAYAPIDRLKTFFRAFGVWVYTSEDIHQLLKERLGEDGAAFGGDYDIPLRIVSSDNLLRHELLE